MMIKSYLDEVANIASSLDVEVISNLIDHISTVQSKKRTLYIVGLGGSAANATHMAADFRKLCQMDARSLDNIAELTARANDEGWSTIFDGFISNIQKDDALLVLSVGGGTQEVSTPLVRAIDYSKMSGAVILGIVGPNGGHTAQFGDCVIKIPCRDNQTPHTEAFQAIVWHLMVSHPSLQKVSTKW